MSKYEYDLTFEEDLEMAVEVADYGESWAERRERSKKLPSLLGTDEADKAANAILMEAGHDGIQIRTEWVERRREAEHQFALIHGEALTSYIPSVPKLKYDADGRLITKAAQILQRVEKDAELRAIMERGGSNAAVMEWERRADGKWWQIMKPRVAACETIEPTCSGPDWFEWQAEALKTLPPVQRRLVDTMVEHLPDPPKPADKGYPKYDARRPRDPNKLRRASGMPRSKMYGTIRQTYDALQEAARCKRYAIEQGLDYADGTPYTTPKPVNRLAYLLERKPFAERPKVAPYVPKRIQTIDVNGAEIPTTDKTLMQRIKEAREPKSLDEEKAGLYTFQMAIVSDLLKSKILQRGAWSPHHLSVGNVLDACGQYAKDALLMVYGWLDRRCSKANNPHERYFRKIKPEQRATWPRAWVV